VSAGMTAVWINVNNRSDRRYSFDASRVTLVTTQGKREKAMPPAVAAATVGQGDGGLAEKLREKAIAEGEIGPGDARSGYLYFRASTYRNARVVVTDIESDEPEGFSIGF